MTDEEKRAFIKDTIAPLFDGMNVEDIWNILHDIWLSQILFFPVLLFCHVRKVRNSLTSKTNFAFKGFNFACEIFNGPR